jgi:hypothetical protein
VLAPLTDLTTVVAIAIAVWLAFHDGLATLREHWGRADSTG